MLIQGLKTIISGAGSAQILQQLCTSGYKYDTFSICSSNRPGYKINASQHDFSIIKMATIIFKMAVKIIIIKQIKTNVLPKLAFFGSK